MGAQCLHCAYGVLKMQRHLKERHTISVQTPQMTTVFAQQPLCAPAELLLPCRRPYCAALVPLSLIRTPSYGVCFEHAQSVRCSSAFYVITQRLLVMPLHCSGDACHHTACTSAFCIFFDTVRTLLWCDRGLNKKILTIMSITFLILFFVCCVALHPKSTAMVMAARSVHLTTPFPGQA